MSKKYVTRTFTVEELDALEGLDLPYDLIDQQYEDDKRWASVWSGVAEIDGEFWKFYYYSDKTEYGMESPWEYGYVPETVVGTKVEKVQVMVDKWKEVEA